MWARALLRLLSAVFSNRTVTGLRLIRRRPVTVLFENTAESSRNNALAHITARAGKHNRVKYLHIFLYFRAQR